MNTKKIDEYRQKLLSIKQKILNSGRLSTGEDLQVSTDDLADETDLATSVINQQISFNIRERELGKLRLIDEALQRIEDGDFGFCEECGDPIGDARLKVQPWASLCIIHAEEREREVQRFARRA